MQIFHRTVHIVQNYLFKYFSTCFTRVRSSACTFSEHIGHSGSMSRNFWYSLYNAGKSHDGQAHKLVLTICRPYDIEKYSLATGMADMSEVKNKQVARRYDRCLSAPLANMTQFTLILPPHRGHYSVCMRT